MRLSPRALYFMLAWAEEFYDPQDALFLDPEEYASPEALFLKALCREAGRILKRGPDREYRERWYEGPGIRGKLDAGRTMRLDLGRCRNAVSRGAELSGDCPQNNAIRSALSWASRLQGMKSDIRDRARTVAARFPGRVCDTIREARLQARASRIHRNNAEYRKALFLSRLLLDGTRPQEGFVRFEDPFDSAVLNRLFEKFIRNVLNRELRGEAKVGAKILTWNEGPKEESDLLPALKTDVTIRSPYRCMVLDAKYYADPFTDNYGARKFRSGHLCQIHAYRSISAAQDSRGRPWSAALVYACAGTSFDFSYDLQGAPLRILGLDLESDPPSVIEKLRGVWAKEEAERAAKDMVYSGNRY